MSTRPSPTTFSMEVVAAPFQFGSDNSANVSANVTNNVLIDQYAHGLLAAVDENATLTLFIDGNDVSNTSANGIFVFNAIFADSLTGTLHATITNNTIASHSTNVGNNADFGGIVVFGGADASDVTFVDIDGNGVTGNPAPGTRVITGSTAVRLGTR